MILSQEQLHSLLEILDKQTAIFIGSTLGQDYLTKNQKKVLTSNGIDVDNLYKQSNDPVLLNFHLGLLSDALGKSINTVSFDQLKYYIASGQHIPLSARERATIQSIKNQALSDITANKGKIFQDINNVVHNEGLKTRSQQESFIKEKILEGISRRESVKKISRELAKLTGDWSRDFSKAVQYISHTALNEGRMAMIQKRFDDPNSAQVYFIVQETACDNCIRCYLKDGKSREPKIFTIRELLQNGSNIGRKASEWLPTISSIHPHCRCLLTEYHNQDKWNKETQRFITPHEKTYHPTVQRNKVRIVINGQEHWV